MAASAVKGVAPATPGDAPLETGDIQGLLASGYAKRLPSAAYLLLEIVDAAAARAWLAGLEVTDADQARASDLASAVQVAFTRPGLETLGLGRAAIKTFSREFQEGMATEQRGCILGDDGDLASTGWEWGGPATAPLHVLLMLFARAGELPALYESQRRGWQGACREHRRLDSTCLPGDKEHFGFHDGIAQPGVRGLSEDTTGDPTNAGEFVLGYRNEYDMYPDSPSIPAGDAGSEGLGPGREAGTKDLGRNGSYLVFRQLEQDVAGFWGFLKERAGGRAQEAVWLGAKMVGRWPNGAPLSLFP